MGFLNAKGKRMARGLRTNHCGDDARIVMRFLRHIDSVTGPRNRPRIDVTEDDDVFELHVDVSDIPPGHFRAEVENGLLIVRTAGALEPAIPGCMPGVGGDSIFCSVPIDEPAEVESVRATYSGDTLKITYQKRKE